MFIINSNTNFCSKEKLPYELLRQSGVIISAMQEVNPPIQKLNKATRCTGAREAIANMKKNIGIDAIFKEGGLSFIVGDKIVKLFVPDSAHLRIRENNIHKRRDFKSVELINNEVCEISGFNSGSITVADFLASVFEKIDFQILQLRKFFRSQEVNQVIQKISHKATLSDNLANITDDIQKLFHEIQARISSVQNGSSRSKIKNGYPKAKPSIHGSKQLEFCGIGAGDNDYSVNIITIAAGQNHLVVKINKDTQNEEVIIVDPKYRVLKEKNLGKVYGLGSSAVYYTQQEVDSPLFAFKLEVLKRELERYNEYLKAKIAVFNAYKEQYTTSELGTIDTKTLALIKDVMQQFDSCKAKMLKIKDAAPKRAFKQKYGIDTRDGSPSLIFKNINDKGEHLHLSFPTMAGVRCMKIIIEKQNGNIGKSLFVNGDKLVKFKATSLGRSKRTDTNSNYYSQEDIDNSGLHEFLQIIKKRLNLITKN